jgi:hypothetical protein
MTEKSINRSLEWLSTVFYKGEKTESYWAQLTSLEKAEVLIHLSDPTDVTNMDNWFLQWLPSRIKLADVINPFRFQDKEVRGTLPEIHLPALRVVLQDIGNNLNNLDFTPSDTEFLLEIYDKSVRATITCLIDMGVPKAQITESVISRIYNLPTHWSVIIKAQENIAV